MKYLLKAVQIGVAALAVALVGCATNIGKMRDPIVDTRPAWTGGPFGLPVTLPSGFAHAKLYVDEGSWPALSTRYRQALTARGATLVLDSGEADYRLHLEGYYRVMAPNGATASITLEDLGKQAMVPAPTATGPLAPTHTFAGRVVNEGASGAIGGAVAHGGPINTTSLGAGLGLSLAFESLASVTNAREHVMRGIESATGVPRNVGLFCTSAEVCANARRRAVELTQQVLLAVDVYRGEDKLARRTSRADGLSLKPTLDEGFGAAVAALADMTMSE